MSDPLHGRRPSTTGGFGNAAWRTLDTAMEHHKKALADAESRATAAEAQLAAVIKQRDEMRDLLRACVEAAGAPDWLDKSFAAIENAERALQAIDAESKGGTET